MACELLRHGIRCRVIDKSDAPSQTSKALGIQPRTLEVFEDMGIVEKMLAKGTKTTGLNIHVGEKRLLRLDTRHLKAPYPYVLALPQSGTEHFLIELLETLGGEVERSREFVDFREERDGTVAVVEHVRSGSRMAEEIQARWLVGCDGAHSRVRKTLGVPFEGSAYEEEFLLADVDLDWARSHDEAHAWLHQDGIFGVLPLPGSHQWRLVTETVLEDNEAPQVSLELFQQLMTERTGDTHTWISNPTWMSNFKISRRMVTGYRRGRVFLAGDAAHIHSPFGGQGMNTGIQDAYNLGWKLALVIKSEASPRLLDTYEEERLPVAKEVLKDTHASTSLVISRNPVLRLVRDHVLTRLLSLGFVQAMMLRENSQLKVNYRKSSLSESYESPLADTMLVVERGGEKPGVRDLLSFRSAPKAGDRAPQGHCVRYPSREETSLFREFRGTKFTLLLFGGLAQTAEGYANLVKIARRVEELAGEQVKTYLIVAGSNELEDLDWDGPVLLDAQRELHKIYGSRAETLYLIRPDGYVGFRSQPAREDRLLDYLGKLFLLGDARTPQTTRS
jgi:2-polyprenyl-6-methoxyphenol hydroxylase-like FAD-dependent oxidoreductase